MVITRGNRSHAFIANETKPFYFDSYCSDMIEACYFFSFHKNEILVMGKLDLSGPHGLPRLAAYFYIITDLYHLSYNYNKISSSGHALQKCMH